MKKKKKLFIIAFIIFMISPIVSFAVGKDGNGNSVEPAGNSGCIKPPINTGWGAKIAVFKATKNKKTGKWSYTLQKAKIFSKANKDYIDSKNNSLRLVDIFGIPYEAPSLNKPKGEVTDLENQVYSGNAGKYIFKIIISVKLKSFLQNDMGIGSSDVMKIMQGVSEDIDTSDEQYFLSVEPVAIVKDNKSYKLLSAYDVAKIQFLEENSNGWACYQVGNQCERWGTGYPCSINVSMDYLPHSAYITKNDWSKSAKNSAYYDALKNKVANSSKEFCEADNGCSSGTRMVYVKAENMYKKLYGINIINITGSQTEVSKTCKEWASSPLNKKCDSGYTPSDNSKILNKTTTLQKYNSTCCVPSKTTCKAAGNHCPNGQTYRANQKEIPKVSNYAINVDYKTKCCSSTTSCSSVRSANSYTCSLLYLNPDWQEKLDIEDIDLSILPTDTKDQVKEKYKTNCCEKSVCYYDPVNNKSTFPKNDLGKNCCNEFKKNYYNNLLNTSITSMNGLSNAQKIQKFKEDYPSCFSGENLSYSTVTPSCKKVDSTYSIELNNSESQETWIKLFNTTDSNKAITSKSVSMGTVCKSKYAKSGCKSVDKAVCKVICYDNLSVNLPATPKDPAIVGKHIVWPNYDNVNFTEAKVTTTKTRICRAMTDKVTDAASKSSCQNYAYNEYIKKNYFVFNSYKDFTINVGYNNSPYTSVLNSTLIVANEDNNFSAPTEVNYDTSFVNSNNNYSKIAKEYKITQSLDYKLDNHYYAYAPKDKSKVAKSSLSSNDIGKYVDVGYGNLPISWTWTKKETKNVSLTIAHFKINDRSGFIYSCQFSTSDPGSKSNKCPANSHFPNEVPPGFSQCLDNDTYNRCVSTYCYDNDFYCAIDCSFGKCESGNASLKLQNCVKSGKTFDYCYKNNCPEVATAIYRNIKLTDPFPGKDGLGRNAGDNWSLIPNSIKTVITDKKDIYEKEPMYEITLTPKDISTIRQYNDQKLENGNGYSDFNLTCTGTTGKQCKSSFIRNEFSRLFKSGTCGLNNNWNECDKR